MAGNQPEREQKTLNKREFVPTNVGRGGQYCMIPNETYNNYSQYLAK